MRYFLVTKIIIENYFLKITNPVSNEETIREIYLKMMFLLLACFLKKTLPNWAFFNPFCQSVGNLLYLIVVVLFFARSCYLVYYTTDIIQFCHTHCDLIHTLLWCGFHSLPIIYWRWFKVGLKLI